MNALHDLDRLPTSAHLALTTGLFLLAVILAAHMGYRLDVIARDQANPWLVAWSIAAALTVAGIYLGWQVHAHLRANHERRKTRAWLAFMNDCEQGRV